MNTTVDTPTYKPGFLAKIRNQLQVIPVTLFGENKEKVEWYAILDNFSTISYVLDTTANVSSAPKAIQFDLNVMHAFDQSVISENLVRFDIVWYNNDEPLFRLNYMHSINNWKFSEAPMQELKETCETYSHLQHIEFPNLGNNKIQFLLGVDATQFILEKEFFQGPTRTPFAIRNLLGWTITGPMKRKADETYHAETKLLSHSYRPFNKFLTCSTFHDEKPLCDYITSFWNIDNAGTEPEVLKKFSKDSELALDIFEKTIRHNGTRNEIGLLWKNNVQLQNNYPVAKAQLSSLQRQLSKDYQLSVLYDATLQTDIEKSYVKPVVFENPHPERIWYLPHHRVCNANKPGKVRRVANAASIFKGRSLNTNLLSGPDLINNLIVILLRFREKTIVVMADEEAMFMQIVIISDDQSCLRFLWPTDQTIRQYQYTRLYIRCTLITSNCNICLTTQCSRLCPKTGNYWSFQQKFLYGWFRSFLPKHWRSSVVCLWYKIDSPEGWLQFNKVCNQRAECFGNARFWTHRKRNWRPSSSWTAVELPKWYNFSQKIVEDRSRRFPVHFAQTLVLNRLPAWPIGDNCSHSNHTKNNLARYLERWSIMGRVAFFVKTATNPGLDWQISRFTTDSNATQLLTFGYQ